MPAEKYPSIDYLRQCFRYADGKLFWLCRPREHFNDDRTFKAWNARWAGREAGKPRAVRRGSRYIRWVITLDRNTIYRHGVVWALHHGEWRKMLDHKDRDSLNDWIDNLRPSTRRQNQANMSISSHNTSGFKGVSWDSWTGRWRAQITANRRRIHIGRFSDPAEAHRAYMAAARDLFGEFASDGSIHQ